MTNPPNTSKGTIWIEYIVIQNAKNVKGSTQKFAQGFYSREKARTTPNHTAYIYVSLSLYTYEANTASTEDSNIVTHYRPIIRRKTIQNFHTQASHGGETDGVSESGGTSLKRNTRVNEVYGEGKHPKAADKI